MKVFDLAPAVYCGCCASDNLCGSNAGKQHCSVVNMANSEVIIFHIHTSIDIFSVFVRLLKIFFNLVILLR